MIWNLRVGVSVWEGLACLFLLAGLHFIAGERGES